MDKCPVANHVQTGRHVDTNYFQLLLFFRRKSPVATHELASTPPCSLTKLQAITRFTFCTQYSDLLAMPCTSPLPSSTPPRN
eukprot:scaffold130296_cov26-Tisochrysis_lutea.AAC.2